MTRRQWWAAVAVGALLVGGCASPVTGSAQGDDDGDSVASESVETSMTVSSDVSSSVEEVSDSTTASESVPGSADAATTSASASESTVPATTAPESDACADAASWTTSEKSTALAGNAPIRGISAASADCYDTFVIEIGPDSHDPGYLVHYVDEITQDGSGFAVPVAGTAKLAIVVDSPAYDPMTGKGTLQIPDHDHVVDVSGLAVMEQIAFAGSFEGQTTFGIGVVGELPFSVATGFDNAGNATLTVSIAHQ